LLMKKQYDQSIGCFTQYILINLLGKSCQKKSLFKNKKEEKEFKKRLEVGFAMRGEGYSDKATKNDKSYDSTIFNYKMALKLFKTETTLYSYSSFLIDMSRFKESTKFAKEGLKLCKKDPELKKDFMELIRLAELSKRHNL